MSKRDRSEPAFMSTRDLAEYLRKNRIHLSNPTLSRWSREGGPWGFPLPDQQTAASPLWRKDRVAAWAERYCRVKDLHTSRLSQLAQAYARWGCQFGPSSPESVPYDVPSPTVGWPPKITDFLEAYHALEADWERDFEALVSASETRLGYEPLRFPAFASLVTAQDENEVSDVLREILRMLPKSDAFEVFGLAPWQLSGTLPSRVEREWPVAEGHPGCQGRLDLVAIYDDREWLVIENKVGNAESVDLAKNAGYIRSLDNTHPNYRAACVVLGGADRTDGRGFKLVEWRDVLLRLRIVTAQMRGGPLNDYHLVVLLGLIGVLERRLLGLRLDRRLSHTGTVSYLKAFHTGTPE